MSKRLFYFFKTIFKALVPSRFNCNSLTISPHRPSTAFKHYWTCSALHTATSYLFFKSSITYCCYLSCPCSKLIISVFSHPFLDSEFCWFLASDLGASIFIYRVSFNCSSANNKDSISDNFSSLDFLSSSANIWSFFSHPSRSFSLFLFCSWHSTMCFSLSTRSCLTTPSNCLFSARASTVPRWTWWNKASVCVFSSLFN